MLTPGRRSGSIALLVLVAASLAACSGGSDPQKQLDSLRSWRATARLAADAVHLGWVPRRYGRQVHDRATAALNEMRQTSPQRATGGDRAAMHRAELDLQTELDSLAAVAAGS